MTLLYCLSRADNDFPDYDKYQNDGEYYNPEFGLIYLERRSKL